MGPLFCHALFHLNLSYSSIETEMRSAVIHACYRPLLRLAKAGIPISIELSGETLTTINTLCPEWTEEFKAVLALKNVTLVGSGYAQVIGPLTPYAVGHHNQRLGVDTYDQLLGIRPKIALINEQAYSRGIVDQYIDAGYDAVIMEWNNPRRCHPEWNSNLRYQIPRLTGQSGRTISLIWNDAIAFQKFQRCAHDELTIDEYLAYLSSHQDNDVPRVFPIYGNDAEIFNFRPGRYHTEAPHSAHEWNRIDALFSRIMEDNRFELLPTQHLLTDPRLATLKQGPISLKSADQPIPVKKQQKYNITRWAVTGVDDLGINTLCHRCCDAIIKNHPDDDDMWRRLIRMWRSDFRTHTTEKRWNSFYDALIDLASTLGVEQTLIPQTSLQQESGSPITDDIIHIETDGLKVALNRRRGLSFDSVIFKETSTLPLIGTLPHGFFENIRLGADFYSGHLVLESPGRPKITDLSPIAPTLTADENSVVIQASIQTEVGLIHKQIAISKQTPTIEQTVDLLWPAFPLGALRLGHITLNPLAFNRASLFYETHNGGKHPERFMINGPIEHGAPISFLVSASHGIGITEGYFAFGDADKAVCVNVDMHTAALMGLVTFLDDEDRFFMRLSPSAGELDETADRSFKPKPFHRRFSFRLSAINCL